MIEKYSLEEFDLVQLNQDLYCDEHGMQIDENLMSLATNTDIVLKQANVIKKGTHVLILGFTHRSRNMEYNVLLGSIQVREFISPIFYFGGKVFNYVQIGNMEILEIFKKISDGSNLL